jgi:hypothetical protein
VTFTLSASDVHESSPIGSIFSNQTVTATNALSIDLQVKQQSSAGAFSDISKAYESGRDVYAIGTAQTVASPGRWYKTNDLPVQIVITNMPVPVYYSNQLDISCSNATPKTLTYASLVQTLPYAVSNVFYESTSNVTAIVTNALWPQTATWPTALGFLTNINVGRYGRITNSIATTNITGVTSLLSSNLVMPLSLPDDVLYGWGVSNVFLIERFDATTNGLPHRGTP